MLESRKRDGVYDCPAIAYSQPCMFFLFMVTFYHAHDISYKGKLTRISGKVPIFRREMKA